LTLAALAGALGSAGYQIVEAVEKPRAHFVLGHSEKGWPPRINDLDVSKGQLIPKSLHS